MRDLIEGFFKQNTAGGILLILSAVLAIIMANSPWAAYYGLLIKTPVAVQIGAIEVAKPLLLWINDGLMAIFFLLVGLELKREVLEGELAQWRHIVLPGLGAIGGMLIPAAIYLAFNHADENAAQGWAIPAATDIAFALGVLSLLGSRVPTSIKVFLTSLAIFDDIGAILIIAFFYTANISKEALAVAGVCLLVLLIVNRLGTHRRGPYFFVGLIMWLALLKSGVHATLAGVLLALFIPLKADETGHSLLHELEHELQSLVAFAILPLFAFANSGINLANVDVDFLFHPVPVGIAAGLFIGKQLGIFAFCWLGVRCGLTHLPGGMTWQSLYGTGILCGIGFTMSLFIGSLAFEETGANLLFDERLGIIIGSLLSGIVGYLVLRRSLPKY